MEHFIAVVHKYPCLWNNSAIEYRDQELKDAAWAEVMKETSLNSVKEVKMKWKKLRDSYRDALKRQAELAAREGAREGRGEARGEGAREGRRAYPWKYMAQMSFLQPHMNNRRKTGSPPPPAAPASDDTASESEPPPGKRPRPEPWARAPPAAPDPLDIFFNSMCQSTKRLPFAAQIKVRKLLFLGVVEAEEALLQQQAAFRAAPGRAPRALWAASSSSSDDADAKGS